MAHIEEKQNQIRNNWEKILKQKTIYKSDVLRLYQQIKGLADLDDQFKPFRNSMNTQVNGMQNGTLNGDRKEKITALCAQYLTIGGLVPLFFIRKNASQRDVCTLKYF